MLDLNLVFSVRTDLVGIVIGAREQSSRFPSASWLNVFR